jgi:hypothetical protein
MGLYEVIRAELDRLIAEAQEKAMDGLTLGEIWTLFEDGVKALVRVAQTISASGAEKKEVVIQAAEEFYRVVVEPIDLPWVPDAIVDPLLSKTIRPFLSWLIDTLVARFNAQGWEAV